MQLISADLRGTVPTAVDKFLNSLGDSNLSGWKPLLALLWKFLYNELLYIGLSIGHAETGNISFFNKELDKALQKLSNIS